MAKFSEFLDAGVQQSRGLYQNDVLGTISMQLPNLGAGDIPGSATALLTEHRPLGAVQYRIPVRPGEIVTRRVPVGQYSVTVTTPGFEPHRAYVDVAEGKVSMVAAALQKSSRPTPTFQAIVEKYGVPWNGGNFRNLTVAQGTHAILSEQSPQHVQDLHKLEINHVDQLKRVFGHADTVWAGNRPRFATQLPAEPTPQDLKENSPALRAALREYVYGNASSVPPIWKSSLVNSILANPALWNLFVLQNVDVGPDSVLEIGNNGLVCDTLRVHITGTVVVSGSGPSVIEMNTYQQFS